MCTRKRAILVVAAIGVFDVIFNFPKIFEYTWYLDDPEVSDCILVNETSLANSDSYSGIYL